MPHAGGIGILPLIFFHDSSYTGNKVIKITVKDIKINAVLENSVIFQFPEVIAVFYTAGKGT